MEGRSVTGILGCDINYNTIQSQNGPFQVANFIVFHNKLKRTGQEDKVVFNFKAAGKVCEKLQREGFRKGELVTIYYSSIVEDFWKDKNTGQNRSKISFNVSGVYKSIKGQSNNQLQQSAQQPVYNNSPQPVLQPNYQQPAQQPSYQQAVPQYNGTPGGI